MNYLYKREPQYENIIPLLHYGKKHGLADMMDRIPEDTKVIICPDGGTNDVKQHRKLEENGIRVICLDHHQISKDISKSPAIIINVQNCDYPSKQLTGAGVAWKFVQAYEDLIYHGEQPEEFADLAALGQIGDMSLFTDMEVRSIVQEGLSNINNNFFKEMCKAHEYVIEKRNGLNYNSIAFAVVPWLNATARSGTPEEQLFIFKGMCDRWAHEMVPNSKRGHKGEQCYWYEEAVTVAERIKRRQSEIQKQEEDVCVDKVKKAISQDEKMILVKLEPDEGEASINGLVANRIQAEHQRPAAVMIRHETDDGVVWSGSMRNYSKSPIQNLKDVINGTGLAKSEGHESAASFVIKDENVDDFIQAMDSIYEDIDQTPTYWIDYSWTPNRINRKKILEIADLNIYGQGIPESLVEIHDIDLSQCQIRLMGAKKNTIKVTLPNGVAIMFFQKDEDFYNSLLGDDKILSVCGKPNKNEWNGTVTPQIIADDYDLEEGFIF